MSCADLLPGCFWEPPNHGRFAAARLRLALAPAPCVDHRARYWAGEAACTW